MARTALAAGMTLLALALPAQALPVACIAQFDAYSAPHHITRGQPWTVMAALGDASPIPDPTGAEAQIRVRFSFADGSPWFDVTQTSSVPEEPRWNFVVPDDAPLGDGHLEFFLGETEDVLRTCTISPLSGYADAHVEVWE